MYNSSIAAQTILALSNNTGLIAIMSAALVGIVGHIANRRLEEYKARIQIRQQRRQAYSQLRGLKFTLSQSYLNYYAAFIYAICYNHLSLLADNPSECSNYEEKAREWKQKSDESIMEIAKNNQRLWELIGLIETVFLPTEELKNFINNLENYTESFEEEFGIKDLSEDEELGGEEIRDADGLWNACSMRIDDVSKHAEKMIETPMDNLLEYLMKEIQPNSS